MSKFLKSLPSIHSLSRLDNEQCRQCSSFSEYVKKTRKIIDGEDSKKLSSDSRPARDDCPLDRDDLGRSTWGLLHSIAAQYPEKPDKDDKKTICQFFTALSKIYPCQYCAEDFREDLKLHPPETDSQEALSQWLCRMHNRVNVKLDKKEFDCSKVNERWRDGWLDGSCD